MYKIELRWNTYDKPLGKLYQKRFYEKENLFKKYLKEKIKYYSNILRGIDVHGYKLVSVDPDKWEEINEKEFE